MTETERCSNCRFYKSNNDICKRYPNAVKKLPVDWCGEWRGEDPEPIRKEREYFPLGNSDFWKDAVVVSRIDANQYMTGKRKFPDSVTGGETKPIIARRK